MPNENPRFTILVPTVGRSNLLTSTLEGLLLQEFEDFEIVVSDNFSNDDTQRILQGYEDNPRVRSFRTERRLSMPDHWEFATGHAKGQFIVVLGDDDGLSLVALRVLDDVIRRTGANIMSWRQASYYHPDWPGNEANTLFIPTDLTGDVHVVSALKVLNDYQQFRLELFPNLLRTCFSSELFARAKARAGQVYVGAPDYSCPALLLMDPIAKYASIDAVLGFGGKSRISNASASVHPRNKKLTVYVRAYMSEFGETDPFPHHEPKVWSISNAMAAGLSYAKWYYPEVRLDSEPNVRHIFKQTVGEIERGRITAPKEHIQNFKRWLGELPETQKKQIPTTYQAEAFRVVLADLLKIPFLPIIKRLNLGTRFRLFNLARKATGKQIRALWAHGPQTLWISRQDLSGEGGLNAMKLLHSEIDKANVATYSALSELRYIA